MQTTPLHPHHLTPDQLRSLEAQIERQITRLQRAAGVSYEEMDRVSDPLDVAASVSLREASVAFQHRSADELTQWARALRRLRESPASFGLCSTCEGPIPFERLDLLPTTTTCVRC